MRYLVLLSVLGRHWESMMLAEGVEGSVVESWSVYYGQLCREAGSCKPTDLYKVAARIASSFKTALYYMRRAGGS